MLAVINALCRCSVRMHILCLCTSSLLIVDVVVRTDLSGKELHKQVGMGKEVTSGSLGGVIVNMLALNPNNLRFDSCSKCNISCFYHTHDTGCHDRDHVQVMHCVVAESTMCTYM